MINAFMQAVNGKLSCCCIVTALNTYTSVESLPLAKNALHCTSTYACICRGASPEYRWTTRRAGARTDSCCGAGDCGSRGGWAHGEGPLLDGELLPAEAPEGLPFSVDGAHAGAIVPGDRTPDREATLLAERDRLAADIERHRAELESSRGAGADLDQGDERPEERSGG